MSTRIQSLPLAVVFRMVQADLMESCRTHDVKVLSIGLCDSDDFGDADNEQSIMVTATIYSKEKCFAKDCGTHPWLMKWDEDSCIFNYSQRWDQNEDDKDSSLPPNVVARLDYAAQKVDTLELSPAEDVDVDEELPYDVTTIRMNYPFEIEGNGSYNVYDIEPATTWGELLTEVIKVFQREYKAGKAIAPHELSDYIIERVDVHPNDLATICIGS